MIENKFIKVLVFIYYLFIYFTVITLKYPRFVSWSYMGYPILTDAYHSMQITMEFRPESLNGLLLYSGEQANLVGDMVSISLVNGFVEFRFDCGMGIGMLLSDRATIMNDWNSLTIYREGWKAWMQLNDGMQVEGRSRGLFSRITFRERLYLGGSPNIELVSNRTASTEGFSGCVRKLEVNNHIYDFSVPGYVVEGVDVAECSADVCGKLVCQNGGQCVVSSPDDALCLCPLGYTGKYCQQKIHIEVPHFNGSSYLKYPGLASTVLSFTEITLVFKPQKPDGVILYNGYKPNSGDFIVINLVDGFVEFRFDLGSGTASLRSKQKVEMNKWHTVFISRTARDGLLQVNNQEPVEGLSPGAFTQLSLPLNLHLGGLSDIQHITSHANIKASFTGCIQKVTINNKPLKLTESAVSGVNIDNCDHSCVKLPCLHSGVCEPQSEFFTCHCNLGFSGSNCEKANKDTILIPMFNGKSYLRYDNEATTKRIIGNKINIRLKFKCYAENGLILWTGRTKLSTSSDYLALGVKNGYVTFQYNLGSGEVIIVSNSSRVDDGKWHFMQAMRTEQEGLLTIDDGPLNTGQSPGGLVQLNVNNGLYIGGVEEINVSTNGKFKSGLVGCISNVTLATDYHVQLMNQAIRGLNIQSCS
ncbi:Pikachurin [Nymphon striatum]|nr:Pikachurin [Nymphon striatum]